MGGHIIFEQLGQRRSLKRPLNEDSGFHFGCREHRICRQGPHHFEGTLTMGHDNKASIWVGVRKDEKSPVDPTYVLTGIPTGGRTKNEDPFFSAFRIAIRKTNELLAHVSKVERIVFTADARDQNVPDIPTIPGRTGLHSESSHLALEKFSKFLRSFAGGWTTHEQGKKEDKERHLKCRLQRIESQLFTQVEQF